jgi:hypothetical protein
LGQFNTKYYYQLGDGKYARTFWFVTPPAPGPDVPYTFGLIGKYFFFFFFWVRKNFLNSIY